MNIIEVLSTEKPILENEIGRILKISRAAVRKQINTLRQTGYTIKSSSDGCTLMKDVDLFNEYEIESKLKKQLNVCKTVKYYKELPSTQTAVKKLAEKDFKEGFVVVAGKQTNGYGRIRREWSSNDGGLWFSMLLKPSIHPKETPKLALLLSIALNRTLEKNYGVSSEIKWPNDVLVLDKKIAGILVEMSAKQNITNWVVAGIGININNNLPKDLESFAVSLKTILKKRVDISGFLAAFLMEFENLYIAFWKKGFKQFYDEYNDKMAYKNKPVTIDVGYGIIAGINLGIDEEGKLAVKTSNGFERIISGTLRGLKK
ncbi:bifunctional ligase/repressor BirA [Endomicrobiia bacterium]|nr:bifunctional ligase/repressor BirA [Endomicrobiia bacterium]